MSGSIVIRKAEPEDAETVHALMLEAFEEYRTADPPSSALDETVQSVREALLAGQGAAVLYEGEKPSAMVRYAAQGSSILFFRLSVIPSARRKGYAKRLVQWVEQQGVSQGLEICRCKVRQALVNNVALYQGMGYEAVKQERVIGAKGPLDVLTMEKRL